MPEQQCTADVLMIRPATFSANIQTIESNRFQNPAAQNGNSQPAALAEFEALAKVLLEAGVRVHIFGDTREPETPDALFPNNWVSFHADASVVLYPMLALNRRQERRQDVLESLIKAQGFRACRIVDMTHNEANGRFLEGTGSLVLDRTNRIAYACLSQRTHLDPLRDFSQQLDYNLVVFDAVDFHGMPIYHTNVLMSVGRQFAVVCADAILPDQRALVLDALTTTGHAVIEISQAQMNDFAGNILELRSRHGGHVVALSERAAASFSRSQIEQLQSLAGPLAITPIPTIENLGGGSVRCMLAEIHLPHTDPT